MHEAAANACVCSLARARMCSPHLTARNNLYRFGDVDQTERVVFCCYRVNSHIER
jgi:hypothetical protein